MRNSDRYEKSNSTKQSVRPTQGDLAGTKTITGKDLTGNSKFPPSQVPPRTKLPGRGNPEETLDRFSPGVDNLDYDFSPDPDDDAVPEEITSVDVEANSQRNLVDDCPSTLDPLRFSNQRRGGAK